jgi:electron transfer flavoprotein beta subunit
MGGGVCVCVRSVPADAHAVELALRIREVRGGDVVVVTMAPESAMGAIRRALAMGADRAVLVSDPTLSGSDLMPTSRVLASVISREAPDLVLFGAGSGDGGGSVLSAAVAERLGWPVLTWAAAVEVDGRQVRASRRTDRGETVAETGLPAVVGLAGPVGTPRSPTLADIAAARRKPVDVLTADDLGLPHEARGVRGSGTTVAGVDAPRRTSAGATILDGQDAAERLFAILVERGVGVG